MIVSKERLTRFGFRYLERYFTSHEARIVLVVRSLGIQELIEGLVALVPGFAGKL